MNNSFVITADPPDSEQETCVANDGWFPDMDPAAVRAACMLDGTVTADRLLPALQNAMLSVNAELQVWADEQRVRWGYTCLADVPAPHVKGESAKLLHYRRAVHACLQAELLTVYRGGTTINTGNKLDRSNDDTYAQACDYRRQQRWAISDLLGQTRCTVELI